MKKLVALLLALLMTASSAAMVTAAEGNADAGSTSDAVLDFASGERTLGDINNDWSVDIQDAVELHRYSMLPDMYPVTYPGLMDFDGSGKIDVVDAMEVFRYSMIPDMFPITWGERNGYAIQNLSINGIDISEYVITTNGSTSNTVAYAASELQKYIALATGVTVPVLNEGVAEGTKRILIDENGSPDDGDQVFRFRTDDDGLVLCGDSVRGCMYTVYHFLEKKLNWRFFTQGTEVCYEFYDLDLSNIDYTYKHQYAIRDMYFYTYNRNPEICVKRYVNGDSCYKPDHGGSICYTPLGIHNFSYLCKIINGNGNTMNPCLNTRRQAMYNTLRDYMKEHPDTTVIQVSQNDTNSRCSCEKCLADEEYYGSPSGLIVETLNWVLEKLNKDWPELKIVTFAYRYSLPAPRNIECHPNLVIEFTPIDLCHQHAITDEACDVTKNEFLEIYDYLDENSITSIIRNNQDVMKEIEKWSKICDTFYFYDYGANFRYYYSPFPNIEALWANYKVYNAIGAWGYINLSNPHAQSVEFGELRTYLYMKLMEEPEMTREEYENHIDEFLRGHYGKAWKNVKEYMYFLEELSSENGECFCVYNSPEAMFGDHAFAPYSDDLVALFEEAEALVANDAASLNHVRLLRISMEYLRLGAIHQAEMESGDEARIQAQVAQVENLYNEILELGVDWITETGRIPEITDFTINPRMWVNGWDHQHYYHE